MEGCTAHAHGSLSAHRGILTLGSLLSAGEGISGLLGRSGFLVVAELCAGAGPSLL